MQAVAAHLESLQAQLHAAGIELIIADRDGPEPPHCVVCSPEQLTAAAAFGAPMLALTSTPTVRQAVQLIKAGASDYLEAPIQADELGAAIERALAEQPLHTAQVGGPDPAVAELPGECAPIVALRERLRRVAQAAAPVLIIGEVGSGKEQIARALHRLSSRRHAPLLSLNCRSLAPELVEAELFGSATSTRQHGLVLAAQHGSLLLEDINALGDTAQARLYDLLTTGSVRVPGSTDRLRADLRVIATVNQPLDALVSAGRFRADLERQLASSTLTVPALRDRPGDAIILGEELLKRFQSRLGRSGMIFSNAAQELLESYHWPGNVRELENAVERAVLLSTGSNISCEDLGLRMASPPTSEAAANPAHHTTETSATSQSVERQLANDTSSLEDYFVSFVLEHQDSLTETELAERLGISRKSLWERRQRLNIPRTKTRKRGRRRDTA